MGELQLGLTMNSRAFILGGLLYEYGKLQDRINKAIASRHDMYLEIMYDEYYKLDEAITQLRHECGFEGYYDDSEN